MSYLRVTLRSLLKEKQFKFISEHHKHRKVVMRKLTFRLVKTSSARISTLRLRRAERSFRSQEVKLDFLAALNMQCRRTEELRPKRGGTVHPRQQRTQTKKHVQNRCDKTNNNCTTAILNRFKVSFWNSFVHNVYVDESKILRCW